MKIPMKYSLSDKDILSLTLYMTVPDICKRFAHLELNARRVYRVLEKYKSPPPLQRRKKFFEDTLNATKVSINTSQNQKKLKVKEAIQLLGEDLCERIDERARLFEEKWT